MKDQCFLILGGAGLVGLQIARRVAHDLKPERIIIASLYQREVDVALTELRSMFGDRPIQIEGVAGNLFVRSEFTAHTRTELLDTPTCREVLFQDVMGPQETAYEHSYLVEIIRRYRPNVIVDSINTATAISYQNVQVAAKLAKRRVDALLEAVSIAPDTASGLLAETRAAFETLLLSEAIPQLIRHVTLLHKAMQEVGTRLYLKIGTTGTGGMGLNIPYTHGEDKPSAALMSKTAVAFAHTGLLFLMARTVNGPIVKELKPGAMIGYADVSRHVVHEDGQPVYLYTSRCDALSQRLDLRVDANVFTRLGPLELPVVDTGENGLFTRGEFEAITSLRQMEFITPEEIAREAVLEIIGSNTGRDVIAAIDGSVMNPTYRAGYLRQQALDELTHLEAETATHSVALGKLGPPQLSKLLWEAELLRLQFETLDTVLAQTPEAIAESLSQRLEGDDNLRYTITSIGVPILTSDGQHLLRGPFIRIPELAGDTSVAPSEETINQWAGKGWVDLRPANFARWQKRFHTLKAARERARGRGSAAVTRETYLFNDIRPGTIVGWIFNNEEAGYRIK